MVSATSRKIRQRSKPGASSSNTSDNSARSIADEEAADLGMFSRRPRGNMRRFGRFNSNSSRNSGGSGGSARRIPALIILLCSILHGNISQVNGAADRGENELDKFQKAAAAFGGYGSLDGDSSDNLDSSLFCTSSRHVHLSVGHDPTTSMTISFSSEPCGGSGGAGKEMKQNKLPKAGVMIGTDPQNLNRLVLESSSPKRYNATFVLHKGTVRQSKQLYTSEWQRHVTVDGLRPDTVYYYRPVTLREGGGLAAGGAAGEMRPEIREDEKVRDEEETEEQGESEVDLLREQEQEEELRDGEEDDERVRGLRQGRLLEQQQKRRQLLHMNPKQTYKYVEDAIALAEHKISKGNLERDGPPSFRTAPPLATESVTTPTATTATPPATTTTTASSSPNVKFAIIGDVAQTKPALDTLSHLNKHCDDITTVLLVGDIAYANGSHELWDSWFDMTDMYGHVFHHKPLMVAPGNHEVERDTFSNQIFASYEARFLMPQVQPMTGGLYGKKVSPEKVPYPLPYDYGNAFYGFKYGLTHNIMLNSFGNFKPDSVQYKWFVKELESVDRDITPWLTVTIHCPLYNTFKWHRRDKQSVLAKKYLEDLLIKYNVNFVLSGHLHAYMRTQPVYNDRRNKKGPIHIILGNGGRQANTPYYNQEPEEWIAVRDHTTYGYGTLEFFNNTHARYEWIQTDANDISTLKVKVGGDNGEAPELAKKHGVKDKVFVKNQLYIV